MMFQSTVYVNSATIVVSFPMSAGQDGCKIIA